MTIHIKRLKVRPRKGDSGLVFQLNGILIDLIAAQTAVCAPELSAMLACWAATGDLHNRETCRETAQSLFQCMRTAVRILCLHVNFHFYYFR